MNSIELTNEQLNQTIYALMTRLRELNARVEPSDESIRTTADALHAAQAVWDRMQQLRRMAT